MQHLRMGGEIRWPNAVWAWEFLRRNDAYRRDYQNHVKNGPALAVLPSGSHLILGERRYRAARKWGLLFFANPDLPAHQAALFWKPSLFSATIPVNLRTIEDEKERGRLGQCPDEDLIILSEICCQRYIFESVNGSRHVILAPRRYWIQLYCDSAHPLDDQALIYFRIDGALHAHKRIEGVKQLLRLHRSSGRDVAAISYRRNVEPLRDAIRALDIKANGGTYGDIVKHIYKPDQDDARLRLAAKQKARRALERGKLYRDGKYLELLA